MNYICVFCSAQDLDEKYVRPAKEFSRLLAQHGYGLVWGGSDTGLMKIVADTVQEHKGRLVGISVDVLKHVARDNADEMIITKDLGERKSVMRQRADAFVVLIGGTGTVDELSEIIEEKILGFHKKPVIILNTDHFYDGLFSQYKRMKDEGFLKEDLKNVFTVCETPHEVIQCLDNIFSPQKA
jgi:uncharacterized protein (TIGR00730 family)